MRINSNKGTNVEEGTDYSLENNLAENLNNSNVLDFHFAFLFNTHN